MSRARRTTACVLAAVLTAGVLAAGPALAADGDDPMPPDFPTVPKPTDRAGGQPDPSPAQWPRVARSEIDAAGDPLPPNWPAPLKG